MITKIILLFAQALVLVFCIAYTMGWVNQLTFAVLRVTQGMDAKISSKFVFKIAVLWGIFYWLLQFPL